MKQNRLLFIILVSASLGCTFRPDFSFESINSAVIDYTVTGCGETENMTISRGIRSAVEARLDAEGGKIHYSRTAEHQCCKKVVLDRVSAGRTIEIIEFWTGPGCRCICFTEISATISNITEGNYSVHVFRVDLEAGARYNKTIILEQEVEVSG